jgi:CheY-like chemotaxis protein
MPEMDGRTTIQHLKANPATRSIPVILMTAEFQALTEENFTGLDVAVIFTKPFCPLKLSSHGSLLEKHHLNYLFVGTDYRGKHQLPMMG